MSTEPKSQNDKLHKDLIQWASKSLVSLGYTLKSNQPENVLNTPWSYIIRFDTSQGYIYLKHTPELLALETSIIQILHDQFHASVATVIAHNAELNCFLMKDAGRSLRVILKQKFDAELFCKAINNFTSLQLAVADHVSVFLDRGVPDWRLDKLPDLYLQLLSQKEHLISDGLSENELSELKTLLPQVAHLSEKLAHYEIKQSIVQPDFNDNNTLIADSSQTITIIDLGEIAISHPFFSLLNCLQQAKKHHGLTDKDAAYLKLMDACLENYLIFGSKKHLLEALDIARLLMFVYAALCAYRLMVACDQSSFTPSFQRHGRPSKPLKAFLAACRKIDGP
jgi:hypothetical protein